MKLLFDENLSLAELSYLIDWQIHISHEMSTNMAIGMCKFQNYPLTIEPFGTEKSQLVTVTPVPKTQTQDS